MSVGEEMQALATQPFAKVPDDAIYRRLSDSGGALPASESRSGAFVRKFTPAGPVALEFMKDTHPIRLIMGPIGSGKTSGCVLDIFNRIALQPPCLDGRIRVRALLLRNQITELDRSLLPTWTTWFPPEIWGPIVGRSLRVQKFSFNLVVGGRRHPVDFEAWFTGIGDRGAEDAVKGMEVSIAYLDEADTFSHTAMSAVNSRTGRFPPNMLMDPADVPRKLSGMTGSFNAPQVENWISQIYLRQGVYEDDTLKVFIQPAGDSPEAENLQNLPVNYYKDLKAAYMRDMGSEVGTAQVRRMIRNEVGFALHGHRVFSQYNDKVHFAQTELGAIAGLPILIGVDQGTSPAAVFGQRNSEGRWFILEEITLFQSHVSELALAILEVCKRYPGYKFEGAVDPQASRANDITPDTFMTILSRQTNIPFKVAFQSNRLEPRLSAVTEKLTRFHNGQPMLLVSQRCPDLHRAMLSGYQYAFRSRSGGDQTLSEVPEKNRHSHIADSLQYLLVAFGELDYLLYGQYPDDGQNWEVARDAAIYQNPVSIGQSLWNSPQQLTGGRNYGSL